MTIQAFGKPLEEKTQEELIEQIKRLRDTNYFIRAQQRATEEAYVKRLADYRKAKALANIRADKAEAALRAVIDALGETE